MMRVLIVEDDDKLGRQIQADLRAAGFETEWATRGDDALAANFSTFGLVILDLMLPGAHGFDVLKALRHEHPHVPVLVLSARQGASDRVRALELGADDFVPKPFWPDELLARVRARLRRPTVSSVGQTLVIGAIQIDPSARQAVVDGDVRDLTKVEFDVLTALASRAGTAVSRRWLADRLLDPGRDADDRALDVHVSRLRRKLGRAGDQIATVWGVGYRLETGA